MCLLCEELWMPFELPPDAQVRTFVADAPEPDPAQAASPPTPGTSAEDGDPPETGADSA